MIEEMVNTALKKIIATDYSYLSSPSVVLAKVASAKKMDTTFAVEDLIIHNDDAGSSYNGKIISYWYEYRLIVIDRFGIADSKFPAIPGIKSKKQFQIGSVVAVAFPYGDINPVIIGEVSL